MAALNLPAYNMTEVTTVTADKIKSVVYGISRPLSKEDQEAKKNGTLAMSIKLLPENMGAELLLDKAGKVWVSNKFISSFSPGKGDYYAKQDDQELCFNKAEFEKNYKLKK